MKLGDLFPSSTLSANDLMKDGKPIRPRVLIDRVEMQAFKRDDGSEEQKPALFFKGLDKALVLNKTNVTSLKKIFGEVADTDEWNGKKIELYREQVPFGGKLVWAVRICPVGGWPPEEAQAVEIGGDPDSRVPF